MGITGEVHNKKGIKIDNAFGKISKVGPKSHEDDHELASQKSATSSAPASKRGKLFGGAKLRKQSLGLTALTKMTKNTKLEQIIEDHPQAEAEIPSSVHLRKRAALTKEVSQQFLESANIIMEDQTEEVSIDDPSKSIDPDTSKNIIDQSGETPIRSNTGTNFTMYAQKNLPLLQLHKGLTVK